ncbi:glucan 1,4-alpha-maltotetraohydrolase domain-containing protein [Chitinivorax sp. B]|uniref:glucan 1,4-alpha-maltotetraohydrolase domain-containing protein n=1 Tax=Chitinivorax sp. B TaxID=2502235 RepID=UPI0014859A7C|nr:glucan 1,4-alpha-maltotetraohydrolase domain-containing protein [Chitinivorax sp. B]
MTHLSLRHLSAAILTGLACLAQPTQAATEQEKASSAILLQGFHWHSWNYNYGWYSTLASKAADMQDLGITHVWFPPPSDAASNEGYLPRQLNVLDSKYGSESALRNTISTLNGKGIKSVVDVVINHRVGTANWADFTNPAWGCNAVSRGDEWSGACGNNDSGGGYDAARDLDHSQTQVQSDLKAWVGNRLKNIGFSGIRYDYSKGYGPQYAKLYHDAMAPNFCVGEIWTDLNYDDVNAHRKVLMNYVDGTGGTCGAFDFTTKGLLTKVLQNGDYWRLKDSSGKPAGGIGWWGQKMVTFVDNHDTGPSENCGIGQNHWAIPCGQVMEGYAYVLTHPGIPSVYYAHVYDWNLRNNIKSLIDIRKTAGITSTSPIAIQAAQNGLYAAIVNGNSGQVAMKIGPGSWSPGTGWSLATSGPNYAVWTKGNSGSNCSVTANFSIANANTANGQSVHVVGNQTALGDWTPTDSFKLTAQGSGANVTWSGSKPLPCNSAIQYKYVKYNGSAAIWESNQLNSSGNREFTTGSSGSVVNRADGNFKF